jgi:hypothetical protein
MFASRTGTGTKDREGTLGSSQGQVRKFTEIGPEGPRSAHSRSRKRARVLETRKRGRAASSQRTDNPLFLPRIWLGYAVQLGRVSWRVAAGTQARAVGSVLSRSKCQLPGSQCPPHARTEGEGGDPRACSSSIYRFRPTVTQKKRGRVGLDASRGGELRRCRPVATPSANRIAKPIAGWRVNP